MSDPAWAFTLLSSRPNEVVVISVGTRIRSVYADWTNLLLMSDEIIKRWAVFLYVSSLQKQSQSPIRGIR